MNSHVDVEHIFLSSDLDDGPTERTVNLEFEQQGGLPRCEKRFTLFNEHHIEVDSRGRGRENRHFEVDLAFLDPRPRRVRRIDWGSVRIAVLLLLVAAAALGVPDLQGRWMAAVLGSAGGMVFLGLAVYRSRDRVVFYSRFGRAPLVMLLNRSPSAAALDSFVDEISRRCERAYRQWTDRSAYLGAELKQHRRLKDSGSLSESAYERVKQRILARHR